MIMTSYDRHLKYFKQTYNLLKTNKSDADIRIIITQFMHYLDKKHLMDKNYLEHHALFLSCEVNLDRIKEQPAEMLLSFLTMIYRIDYIDANSDAFMIYYKNQMINVILKHLIDKIQILKGV